MTYITLFIELIIKTFDVKLFFLSTRGDEESFCHFVGGGSCSEMEINLFARVYVHVCLQYFYTHHYVNMCIFLLVYAVGVPLTYRELPSVFKIVVKHRL